jgi:hypothetical protein
MKKLKYIVTAVACVAFAMAAFAQESKDQLVIPLSSPGKPYKLDVGLVSGSIKVSVYDGQNVIVDVQSDSRKEEKGESNGMHRIGGGDSMDINANENQNSVHIGTGSPNKATNLIIKVPRGMTHVKLGTVNGGDITAHGLSGDIEVSNVNGAIRLTDVSGSVVANTVNGGVLVTFNSVKPDAAMAFSTLNGDVDITFPASYKADVKLQSENGEIMTDFDIATTKSAPKVTKEAANGSYRLKFEDWVYGKINGGGPELMMKNMQGSIYIRKAK